MSAIGSNTYSRNGLSVDLAKCATQITVAGPDVALSSVFSAGYCRRVVAQAAGTVFIQRQDDPAAVSYVLVAGAAVEGIIILIGGTTNHATASAIALNLEV